MKSLLSVFAVVLASSGAYAQSTPSNPGKVADHCVNIETKKAQYGDTVYYDMRNSCDQTIFVIYCGDVVGSNRRCDGGSKSVYYTHSKILRPGISSQAAIRGNGQFHWGACIGSIGFGNEGHFQDFPDGRYTCLAR